MSKTYAELLEVAEQIRQNELPESNTHDLVGGLLRDLIDFLQLDSGTSEELMQTLVNLVKTEATERKNADAVLQSTINVITSRIDQLVGENASQAIDNFNEIINFLNGLKDSDSLAALLADINERIGTKFDSVAGDDSVWGELKKLGGIITDLGFINDLRDLDEVYGVPGLFAYRYNDERNEFLDIKGLLATSVLYDEYHEQIHFEQIRYEAGFIYRRQQVAGEWSDWKITGVSEYNVSWYHLDPDDNTNRFDLDKAIYCVPVEIGRASCRERV